MIISFPRLATAAFVLVLAAPADARDPLQGYEQVEPAAVLETPAPGTTAHPAEQVERGRYLVTLLGCGGCHTDGALLGNPNLERLLAGSSIGIATSNPMEQPDPGIVYPSNLTPDPKTGLGGWSQQEIMNVLLSGTDNHGSMVLPVMPWMNYRNLLPEDADAIAMYLQSLPPVKHRVPKDVKPGQKATEPFVHFGVYRAQP
jgi:mono/diheme cytochrome c family protein